MCCVLFEGGVIFCAMCYWYVVSYCSTTVIGKNPLAVKMNNKKNSNLTGLQFLSLEPKE
jgi:hypothetical protein